MSGSLGSLALSLFNGGAGSTTGNLLTALYGTRGTTQGSPVAALQTAEANSTKDIAQTAAQPATARDIAAFKAAVASATTPAQLLKNPTVLKVLLTANGLADQVQYPALAQKALLSDPSQAGALANTLSNTAWKATAQTYAFATSGLSVIKQPAVLATIANGYAEVTWRDTLDKQTPGLSEALTFRSAAATITSADQILGDPTLRTVVTTALGIPEQIAFQDLGAQEKAITDRVDITKFKDPKFVETFVTRYLLAAQTAANGTSSASQSLDSLAAQARSFVA